MVSVGLASILLRQVRQKTRRTPPCQTPGFCLRIWGTAIRFRCPARQAGPLGQPLPLHRVRNAVHRQRHPAALPMQTAPRGRGHRIGTRPPRRAQTPRLPVKPSLIPEQSQGLGHGDAHKADPLARKPLRQNRHVHGADRCNLRVAAISTMKEKKFNIP